MNLSDSTRALKEGGGERESKINWDAYRSGLEESYSIKLLKLLKLFFEKFRKFFFDKKISILINQTLLFAGAQLSFVKPTDSVCEAPRPKIAV